VTESIGLRGMKHCQAQCRKDSDGFVYENSGAVAEGGRHSIQIGK